MNVLTYEFYSLKTLYLTYFVNKIINWNILRFKLLLFHIDLCYTKLLFFFGFFTYVKTVPDKNGLKTNKF
jgi:hypothetical protein